MSKINLNNFQRMILESDETHYRHVKDLKDVRPRFVPTPKPKDMNTNTAVRYFGLYVQDQASDIMVDKYGLNKGLEAWNYFLKQSNNAMFSAASKVANEKLQMIRDLGLKYGNDYFKRSYLDIWKEWSTLQGRTLGESVLTEWQVRTLSSAQVEKLEQIFDEHYETLRQLESWFESEREHKEPLGLTSDYKHLLPTWNEAKRHITNARRSVYALLDDLDKVPLGESSVFSGGIEAAERKIISYQQDLDQLAKYLKDLREDTMGSYAPTLCNKALKSIRELQTHLKGLVQELDDSYDDIAGGRTGSGDLGRIARGVNEAMINERDYSEMVKKVALKHRPRILGRRDVKVEAESDTGVDTMAIERSVLYTIVYNPEWVETLSDKDVERSIAHELQHVFIPEK